MTRPRTWTEEACDQAADHDPQITGHPFEPYQLGNLEICIYLYGDPPRDPCGRSRSEHEHAPDVEEETAGA